MCGFVGVWQRVEPVDKPVLGRMRSALAHRGPDDQGEFFSVDGRVALGFQRLSIIDLSSAGHQPMLNRPGTKAIVFNGEVFNFSELRHELESRGRTFHSRSDTEVVLQAFEEFGPACLDKLHGMFAFAIWDEEKKTIFLARDRFGIKPLYYFQTPSTLLFGSELKALVQHPAFKREIDPSALEDYLAYGYVPYDQAIFRGARKVPAAHFAQFDGKSLQVRRYWELKYRPSARNERQVIEEVRAGLEESVQLWKISDVPVGVFLSGGIDSSAVCAMLAKNSVERPHTFSIGFDHEKRNELPFAREVAEAFSTKHKERIVGIDDARQLLDVIADVYDEPFYDSSSIPTWYVSRFAREQVPVVLSGDGGDELFFGYHRYEEMLRLQEQPAAMNLLAPAWKGATKLLRGLPYATRIRAFEKNFASDPMQRYFCLQGFFDQWEISGLLGRQPERSDPLWLFRKFHDPALPQGTALRMLDAQTYLVDDILAKVDRASMAHSLEARTPLLEHKFAELVFSIPDEMHYLGKEKKHILKAALSGVLPDSILKRGKKGFSAPVRAWLMGRLGEVVEPYLVNGHATRDGLLDPQAIRRVLSHRGQNRWAKIWMLLMLEGWYRRWVSGEVPAGKISR